MIRRVFVFAWAVGMAAATAVANSPSEDRLSRLAGEALTREGPAAEQAVAELRAGGPRALDALFALRRDVGARSLADSDAEALAARQRKLEGIIDRVAGQMYAHDSGLYWYTDFDAARAAARASGKPILSLRMLGKLTDEYSCANSRFFRTTLYPNLEVAKRLREGFVLHWKTVRPVPRVTIDFGDGRQMECTVTGNSAHYALAADGTPLDVLPGLYGPQQFLAWLDDVDRLHAGMSGLSADEREARLREHHRERSRRIVQHWGADLAAVMSPVAAPAAGAPADVLAKVTTHDVWRAIGQLPSHAVRLDTASARIIRRENPDAIAADERAVTKSGLERPILRMVTNLERSIAEDGARNEYLLHREVHEWFASGDVGADLERLNDHVYAELFLSPNDDPWHGLDPTGAYTALRNGGVAAQP